MISGKLRIVEYGPLEDPLGYMEPDVPHPSWILWWYQNGRISLYTKRSKTGAVQGKAIELAAPKRVSGEPCEAQKGQR